jgi:hypothetical protein
MRYSFTAIYNTAAGELASAVHVANLSLGDALTRGFVAKMVTQMSVVTIAAEDGQPERIDKAAIRNAIRLSDAINRNKETHAA